MTSEARRFFESISDKSSASVFDALYDASGGDITERHDWDEYCSLWLFPDGSSIRMEGADVTIADK